MTRTIPFLLLTWAFMACGDDTTTARPDTPAVDFSGVFSTVGTVDLSGPITASESIGDGVARLIIDGLVARATVPDVVKGQLRQTLELALRDPIAAAVDAQTPAEWQIGGAQHALLSRTLAAVEMETALTLTGTAAGLTGTQRITAIRVPGDVPLSLDLTSIDAQEGGVLSLTASITGRVSGSTLTLDPHVFALRLDALIEQIVTAQSNGQGEPLEAFLAGHLDCEAILGAISAQDGLRFEVAGLAVGFTAATLEALCSVAVEPYLGRTAGAVSQDTGLELGGAIDATSVDENNQVMTLATHPDYGGQFTALPIAANPRLSASFTGVR